MRLTTWFPARRFLNLALAGVLIYILGILSPYFNFSAFFYIGIFSGLLCAGSRGDAFLLASLSFGQFLYITGGGSLGNLWKDLQTILPVALLIISLTFIYLWLTFKLPTLIRVLATLLLFAYLSFLELPLQYRLSLMFLSWPLLLSLSEDQAPRNWAWLRNLIPFWYAQFFHNIPTEPSPRAFTQRADRLSILQTEGIKLLAAASGWALAKYLFDRAFFGGELLNVTLHPILEIPRMLNWDFIANPLVNPWLRIYGLYIHFISFFLMALSLGTLVNATARIWGYDFPLNVQYTKGMVIFTQWRLYFYYLNNVVTKIFFWPIYKKSNFISHKRLRASFALIFSVFGFGYCYLTFLFNSWSSYPIALPSLFSNRALYLTLICLVGLFKINILSRYSYSSESQWRGLIYFLLVTPIIMIGLLSLDPHFLLFE